MPTDRTRNYEKCLPLIYRKNPVGMTIALYSKRFSEFTDQPDEIAITINYQAFRPALAGTGNTSAFGKRLETEVSFKW